MALHQQTCHAMSEKYGCKLSITLVLLATGSGSSSQISVKAGIGSSCCLSYSQSQYVPYFLIKLLQSAFGGCYLCKLFCNPRHLFHAVSDMPGSVLCCEWVPLLLPSAPFFPFFSTCMCTFGWEGSKTETIKILQME